MVPVNSLISTVLNPGMMDVLLGIGIIKFVLNAQKDGLWLMVLVFQLVITALLMILLEPVLNALVDMTSLMENVNSHHSTMLSHLIQDVLNGIGTIKFACNVLKIGFSMLMVLVYLSLTSVPLIIQMVFVLHVTKDMT